MAEEIVRKCDYPIRGTTHGVRVPDDKPTDLRIDGVEYEIDLCAEHQELLAKRLEPFLEGGRATRAKVGNTTRRAIAGSTGGKPFTTKEVRDWLTEQGRDVPPSGRLPNDAFEEYAAAHHR